MDIFETTKFLQVPLIALKPKTRCSISQMLNGIKIIPSPSGLPRDWRGLAHIANTSLPPANACNPTNIVLEEWGRSRATVTDFVEALKELDRWDLLYDTISLIESDATSYFNSKDVDQNIVSTNSDTDKYVLTIDDIRLTEKGLEPQLYDAFLLYSDDDLEFAKEIVDKLENEHQLKLCLKDRDLVGGVTFEHEAIMRLISERCNRIIIVVSPSFLNSSANKFFVTFAQAIGIEQGRRKIIPCIYKRVLLPQQLSYYYVLDYTRKSQWWDFWTILSKSVVTLPNMNASKNQIAAPVSIKEVTDETENLALEEKKGDIWRYPVKSNQIKAGKEPENAVSCKPSECESRLPVHSKDSPPNSKSKFSLLTKVLPESLKEKSRSKTWFKKKKKKKVALTS